MQKPLQIRVQVVLLSLFTVAAAVLASLNFAKEGQFQAPTDGVWWVEAHGGLKAERVPDLSPGERAGIKANDLLLAANGMPTARLALLARQWYRTGTYRRIDYTLQRGPVRMEVPVILVPPDRSQYTALRIVAAVYLLIGLYILFRRWTAPHATHFYIFCLASFVLYAFHHTGKLNPFDWTIFWGNVVAGAIQPALFLHFALAFPTERASSPGRRWAISLLYLPGACIFGLQAAAVLFWSATGLLQHRLDQLGTSYLAVYYLAAAGVFLAHYRRADTALRRQQLKWLSRGAILAVLPFTLLNALPYLLGWPVPTLLTEAAALSLVFVPLTFSWAIVRYRLMDVDLIFKRGVTYTLATATLLALYFGAVAVAAEVVHTRLPSFGAWGLIVAIIVTAQLFDPLKRGIQQRVDRVFDRNRYDYRQTLIEFGRGLSSETDLDALLAALVDRLPRALLLSRVAIFLPQGRGYRLAAGHGLPAALTASEATVALDLDFLRFDGPGAPSHIFLESPQSALHLPVDQRFAVAALDLNFYLPCRAGKHTIAVLGFGRTNGGDFLSSEDVELLESLASYIGIAIQNARLYASLAEKAAEYERLKEFSENIVESINVGIFAIAPDETVESWNAQMEVLCAQARSEVLGRGLAEVLPASFVEEFRRVRDVPGVHNLYKFRLEMRTGETRTANIAIAPLVSRTLEVVGRIVLVDDITDRVQLEAQLAQAEKLSSIGLLAAGVAHEVNTPLAVISSYTQMLAKQLRALPDGNDRLSGLLDKITSQTFRASEIVNGLLNFSRTGGSEFRDISLNAVIEETLTLLEHQFKTSQVRLETALDPALPAIRGNPGKLQQVFLNLFLNAKDAMSGGGTLRVATEVNGQVGVLIADTGAGIAPEHLPRIYDPFFTTKAVAPEGQRRGTGLGLAVTYGIIQEHAGKIHVESQPGRGTTFHLEFPAVRKPVHV